MSKKFDDKQHLLQTSETEEAPKEVGLVLTVKQSWLFVAGILIFFSALLFFGYQDWQQQQRMQQKFEEHLRSVPTS